MRPFSLHHFSSSFHFGGRNQRSNAAVLPASTFSWPHFPDCSEIWYWTPTECDSTRLARPRKWRRWWSKQRTRYLNWTRELSCFDRWVEPWRVPWCAEPKDFCLFSGFCQQPAGCRPINMFLDNRRFLVLYQWNSCEMRLDGIHSARTEGLKVLKVTGN